MNRYVTAGAIKDARKGKKVVVATTWASIFLARFEAAKGVRFVERTNGSEHVEFNGGGSVHLVDTAKGSLRGFAPDVVFLDGGSPRDKEDAIACLSARAGELIVS